MTFEEKVERLAANLRELESVAVAFSGGVDSSVLLHAASRELGANAVAVIADSPSLPRAELAEARELARTIGAKLIVVRTEELADERYRANAGDRCYWCKTALFERMAPWAREHGYHGLAFGEIADDLLDDRPGARAAREFGVVAPLSAAGFTKDDVREYARRVGLAVAEKPSSACLASRIPVGTRVSAERLARIESVEAQLRELGVRQVRVRDYGKAARVEVGEQEHAFAETLDLSWLAEHGFEDYELTVYLSPAEKARRSALPS